MKRPVVILTSTAALGFGFLGGVALADHFDWGSGASAVTGATTAARDGAGGNLDLRAVAVNDSGQTYGDLAPGMTHETTPDLIRAIGVMGVEGYVLRDDLFVPVATNPDEAVASMSRVRDRTIPVYDVSGEVVVDSYVVNAG